MGCLSGSTLFRVRSRHTTCFQWLVAWTGLLFFSLISLTGSSFVDYQCVYTNSTTNSYCSSLLCPQGCFYPLLPLSCSPDGLDLTYSDDSRPGTSNYMSVEFNGMYNVSQSIINQFSSNFFDDSFTLAFWVKSLQDTQSLKVIVDLQFSVIDLIVFLNSDWLFITNSTFDEEIFINTTQKLDYSNWHHIVIIVERTELIVNVNGTDVSTPFSSFENPGPLESVTIAGTPDADTSYLFRGLIQDIGIFSYSLSDSEVSRLSNGTNTLSGADFLPQCLCPQDSIVNATDSQFCNDGLIRYNASFHAVEFITDNNAATYWQSSSDGFTSVSLGLNTKTSLSKIFIDFETQSPMSITLQFLNDSKWTNIHYYAQNCSQNFGLQSESMVNSIDDAICQDIAPTDTNLAFYVFANGRESYSAQLLRNAFTTMQIRLLITHYTVVKLTRVQVCANFDNNLNEIHSCDMATISSSILSTSTENILVSSDKNSLASSSENNLVSLTENILVSFTENSIQPSSTLKIDTSSLLNTLNVVISSEMASFIEVSLTSSLISAAISNSIEMAMSSDDNVFIVSSSIFEESTADVSTLDRTSVTSSTEAFASFTDFFSTNIISSTSSFIVSTSSEIIEPSSTNDFDLTSFIGPSSTNVIDLTPSLDISSTDTADLTPSIITITSTALFELTSTDTIELTTFLITLASTDSTPSIIEPTVTESSTMEFIEITSSGVFESNSAETIESTVFSELTSSNAIEPTFIDTIEFTSTEDIEPTSTEITTLSTTRLISSETISTTVMLTSSESIDLSSVDVIEPTSSAEFASSTEAFEPTSTELIEPTEFIELSSSEFIEPTSFVQLTSTKLIEATSSEFIKRSSTEIIEPTSSAEFISLSSTEITELISSSEFIELSSTELIELTSSAEFVELSSTKLIESISSAEFELSSTELIEPTSSAEFIELSSTELIQPTSSAEFVELSSTELIQPTSSAEFVELSSTELIQPTSSAEFVELSSTELIQPTSSAEFIELSSTELIQPTSSPEFVELSSTEFIQPTSSAEFIELSSTELIQPTSSAEFIELSSTELIEPTSSSDFIEVSSTELSEPTSSAEFIDFSSTEIIEPISSSESFEISSTEVIEPTSSVEFVDLSSTEIIESTSSAELIEISSTEIIEPTSSAELIEFSSTELIEPTSSIEFIDLSSTEIIESTSSAEFIDLSSTEIIEPTSSAEFIEISSTELIQPTSSAEFIEFSSTELIEPTSSAEFIGLSSTEIIEPTSSAGFIEISSTELIELTSSAEFIELSSTEIIEPTSSAGFIEISSTELIEPTSSAEFIELSSTETVQPTSIEVIEPSSSEFLELSSTEITEPTSSELIELTSTEVIERTSTEVIEPTSTEVIEPTSTEFIELTSTEVIEPTSTEVIEPTSTEVIEPTSTEVIEPTSTEVIEPTSTEVIEPTSTEVIEPTLTEVIEPTSTEVIEPTSTEDIEVTSSLSIRMLESSSIIVPSSIEESVIEETSSLFLDETSTIFDIFSSSSIFSSTVEVVVSPSPTLVRSSIAVTPTVIINDGIGLLLKSPERVNNETRYNFSYGLFGIKMFNENEEGSIKAQLGNFSSEVNFTQRRLPALSFSSIMSTRILSSDHSTLTLVIQGRDKFGSTYIQPSVVVISAFHNTLHDTANYTCTINDTSHGSCNIRIKIKSRWFRDVEETVSLRAIVNDSLVSNISSIILSPVMPTVSTTDALYIQFPQISPFPGSSVSLSIMSSFNYSIFGFNIDCNITNGASILSPYSPKEYSLLSAYYQNNLNRIALTGFRNRDEFDINPINESIKLVSFTVNVPPSHGRYSLQCSIKGLSLTTRRVIVSTVTGTLPVQMISANGTYFEIGVISTQVNTIMGILPYTQHNMFLNIATVNGTTQYLGSLSAISVYSNGTISTIRHNDLLCSSNDTSTINVLSNCSNIFFNGSETKGTVAEIIVQLSDNVSVNNTVPLSIWKLQDNLSIVVDDPILNATSSCDNTTYYQTSNLFVIGSVWHNSESHSVYLTSLLTHLIKSQNNNTVQYANNKLEGKSAGSTQVCIKSWCSDIIVSDEMSSPEYLSLFPFSNIIIDLEVDIVDSQDIQIGVISILQDFHYQNQPVYVNTILVYDDSTVTDVDMSNRLSLSVNHTAIINRSYIIDNNDESVSPNIEGRWSQCMKNFAFGSVSLNVSFLSPVYISLQLSHLTIAPASDALVFLAQRKSLSILSLTAVYQDTSFNTPINTALINTASEINISNSSVLNVHKAANGNISLIPLRYGYANISVYVSQFNMMTNIVTISVIQSEPRLHFVLVSTSNVSVFVNSIQRISSTNIYQQVIAETVLYILPDGTNETLTNSTVSISHDSALTLNGNILSVRSNITNNITETVTANIANQTITASLNVVTTTCHIETIRTIFTEQFIALAGTVQVANCELTFCDGTQLMAFNENGFPIYGDLVTITTNDSSIAVSPGTSNISLVSTSFTPISLTCTAEGASSSNHLVICNTLPADGQIDLGSNSGLPANSVVEGDIITVPVTIGAISAHIGVIEINMKYDQTSAVFIRSLQGENWSNGSLISTNVDNGTLRIGGVLNGGVQNNLLQFAELHFKAQNNKSLTQFEATPILLSAANLSFTSVVYTPTLSTLLSVSIDTPHNIRRREVSSPFCAPNFPLGDINADCYVDLRDVYYFQEYNLASVHNFQGSDNAIMINQTIENNNIVLDVDGDGQVTLDDIVTVVQIGSGLIYNLSASYVLLCDCTFNINITVSTVNQMSVNTDDLHMFVHLSHSSSQFIEEIIATVFTHGTLLHTQTNQGISTAIIRATLNTTTNDTALYQVKGTSNFSISSLGISVIQAVANSEGIISESRVAGLFGNQSLVVNQTDPFVISFNATETQTVSLTLDNLMPHFIVNPSCSNTPPSIPPPPPIVVSTSGMGYFINNVQINSTTYKADFAMLENSREGTLSARVGHLQVSKSFNRNLSSADSLRTPVAFLDQTAQLLYTTVQVFNAQLYSFANFGGVDIMLRKEEVVIMNTTCTPNNISGICQATFNINSSVLNSTPLNVIFSLQDNPTININTTVSIPQISLWSITNNFVVEIPPYSVKPGSEFNINVYSNTTYPLISFLLNITIPNSINISNISAGDISRLWGVHCTSNSLCVGYRTNFQTLSTSALTSREHLFTATLSIPFNYDETTISVSVSVLEAYDVFYQSLQLTSNPLVVNTTSSYPNTAQVSVASTDTLIGVYAYTSQSTLVNTAKLDGKNITIPIHVVSLYSNNSLIEGESYEYEIINGTNVLQLASDYSSVFVNGSESAGSDSVLINVSLRSFSSQLRFKVWYPTVPIALHLDNKVLKAINGAVDPITCNQLYQSSKISALTNLTTNNEIIYNVDLSDYVLETINISPRAALSINTTSRIIQGISPSDVILSSKLLNENITIQVSNEFVTLQYLYTFVLTNLTIDSQYIDNGVYSISISFDPLFYHHGDVGYTSTIASFNDNSSMIVTDLVSVISDSTIFSTNNDTFMALTRGNPTIKTEWNNPNTCVSSISCVRASARTLSINLTSPIELLVSPNESTIAATDLVNNISSIPFMIRVSVFLLYTDGTTTDVTSLVNTYPSLRRAKNQQLELDATLLEGEQLVNFTYNNNGITLFHSYNLQVVNISNSLSSLILRSTDNTSQVTMLQSIQGTTVYQRAMLVGSLGFTNGNILSVNDLDPSHYTLSYSKAYINITQDHVVIVHTPPNQEVNVSINLQLTGMDTIFISVNLIIKPTTQHVSITNISIVPPVLIGRVRTRIELDVLITLAGGIISSLRSITNNEQFTNLVQFMSSPNDVVSIDSNTGDAIIYQNSHCGNVSLTATVKALSTINTSLSLPVTILPEPLGLALNNPSIVMNTVSIPLYINTNDVVINAIEGTLIFNGSSFQVLNISVEQSQWPGGVLLYDTSTVDNNSLLTKLKFGGLALNGGLKGSMVHIANVNIISEGTNEIYGYLTNAIHFEKNTFRNLPLESPTVYNASRIIVTVTNNCHTLTDPKIFEPECTNGRNLQVANDQSFSCPINLNTSTEGLFNRLEMSTTDDINLDGIGNILDPLYSIQVSVGLLGLLNTSPSLVNSTRDSGTDSCNITISSKLIQYNGQPTTQLTLYYLLNIENYTFNQLFNVTADPVYLYDNNTTIILPSTYNTTIEEFVIELSTIRTEIPPNTLSISLIQLNNLSYSSPASLFPMIKPGGNKSPLNIQTEEFQVYLQNRYSPLVTYSDSILCPELVPSFSPSPSPSPSPSSLSSPIPSPPLPSPSPSLSSPLSLSPSLLSSSESSLMISSSLESGFGTSTTITESSFSLTSSSLLPEPDLTTSSISTSVESLATSSSDGLTVFTTSLKTFSTMMRSPSVTTDVSSSSTRTSSTISSTQTFATSLSSNTLPSMSYNMTPMPTSPTDGTGNQGAASVTFAVVGVLVAIIAVLVIILLVVIVVVMRHRSKKRGTMDFYRPGSRTSKDYWFEVEETVEMSPIDIVPVDQQPHYLDETVMDSGIIENKGVFTSEEFSTREESLSSRPLVNHIKPQPRTGRTVTFDHATYTDDSSLKPSRQTYTDDDNESLIDLNFNEDVISQPYLSLGLTPLSQLSPDPLTSNSNTELGFFPSMLPPVSPLTSLNTGTGISVDTDNSPGHHELDNLVMPDAMPSYTVPLNDIGPIKRNKKQSKQGDLVSNGNVSGNRILGPLIEQRSLEADDYSSGVSDLAKGLSSSDSLRAHRNVHNLTSGPSTLSSDSAEDSDTCIFPSAHIEASPLDPRQSNSSRVEFPHDTHFLGNLNKGPTTNYKGSSAPKSFMDTDFLDDDLFDDTKQRRQQERERAKAEQKALLLRTREEEEKKKQAKSREIHDSIVRSYSTFNDQKKSPGNVLQKVARLDAEAELLKDEEVKRGQPSQDSLGGGVGNAGRYPPGVFVSPQHRYSNRPRQASVDSIDMKVTNEQITAL